MHVLAMAHAYPPHHNAGGELTMHVLLRHLAARGHRVDVVLSRQQRGAFEPYVLDGVNVHPHTNRDTILTFFAPASRKPDVIIAHLENTMRAAALAGIHGVPMAHLVHNDHEFTKGAFRRGPTQLAVFNTHWMREEFQSYWSFHQSGPMPPHVVVHPPVDPKAYAGTHGREITLINLNEDKGGRLFWELSRRLSAKPFLGVEGAYGVQLYPEDYVEDEGYGNVEIIGHVAPTDMVTKVYARTKILLMPSVYESYGRTAIEAAYSGIPTIAHPTPGLREALGDAGTFCHREDPDAWVQAITYLSSPRGFSAASAKAKAHAASLDPTADLDRFADAMEGVVRRGFAALAR